MIGFKVYLETFWMSSTVSNTTKPNRRGWIDYARGFVIIYVVYRHALTGLLNSGVDIANVIYLVQESSMPVFFIVSGIFIRSSALKRGLDTFVRFKFESLVYPYLVWAAIHLTIQIAFNSYSNSDKDLYYFVYLFIYPRAIDQFWYLYTLFAVMFLFAVLNFKILKFNSLANLLVAIALYFISFYVETNYFAVHDAFFYYIFLVFGFLIADTIFDVNGIFFRGKWLFYVLPFFVLLQVYWFFHYPNAHFVKDLDYIGFILFVPITIIGALLLFFISYKLDQWGYLKTLKYIGGHSLYIYIMHLIFTSAIRVLVLRIYPSIEPFVLLILIIVGGVVIPIFCYRILIRLGFNSLFVPPERIRKIIYFGSKPQ